MQYDIRPIVESNYIVQIYTYFSDSSDARNFLVSIILQQKCQRFQSK